MSSFRVYIVESEKRELQNCSDQVDSDDHLQSLFLLFISVCNTLSSFSTPYCNQRRHEREQIRKGAGLVPSEVPFAAICLQMGRPQRRRAMVERVAERESRRIHMEKRDLEGEGSGSASHWKREERER